MVGRIAKGWIEGRAKQRAEVWVEGKSHGDGEEDLPEQCMVTSGKERVAPKALTTMATQARPQSQMFSCLMWGTGVETCMCCVYGVVR